MSVERKYRDYELQRVDRCPIDIYVASNMPYPYPYKLGKPAHQSHRIRDSCTTWIQDSGIGDDTTNAEVLELAKEFDADFVVPCDEIHDQEATTDAVYEFLELYDESDVRATPMIPLQPPHHKHVKDFSNEYAYMMGGVMKKSWFTNGEVVELAIKLRKEIGDAPHVHLLGRGGSIQLANQLTQRPNLIQSLDCSTPEKAAINGSIIDARLRQEQIEIKTGDASSVGRYSIAETNAYQLNDAYTVAANRTQGLGAYK